MDPCACVDIAITVLTLGVSPAVAALLEMSSGKAAIELSRVDADLCTR